MSKMSVISETKLKCPIAVKWTIPEKVLKELKDGLVDTVSRDTFYASNIPGLQYYLLLQFRDGQLHIKLCYKRCGEAKIGAFFDIIIESANYNAQIKYVSEFFDEHWEKFCTTEEIFDPEKWYIIDGEMTIKMDGFLIIEKDMKIESFGDHRDALCLGLWNQENKDFAVGADGKEIPVHKCVLTAQSPVFAKMFESGMKENKVTIEDFSFDVVEKAIKLCYHQSLVPHSTLEDKMKLLHFFDKYEFQPLKNALETFLIAEVDESNVCYLTNTALLSNSRKLEKQCTEFLRECLQNTKPIADFDLLDKDFALNFLKTAFYPVT